MVDPWMIEGSKARSKGGEGSKARSKKKRGLKGALEKERRAQRRARKEARAQRRARKEVGLGNTLPRMVEKGDGKIHRFFFCFFCCGLILVGDRPGLEFLKGENFPKVISNSAILRWPSI